MKILVTGATGFVGNHIVNALLAQGHDVVASSRNQERARCFSWYDQVTFLPLAIGGAAAQVFERSGCPDLLIHAAWGRLENYYDPVHFVSEVFEHFHFIRNMVNEGLDQCMVLGTCLEYGMQNGMLHERMEAKPILAYPIAKNVLRQLLEGLQALQPFSLQWVRLFYLFGEGQRRGSLLGQLDAAIASRASSFDMSMGDQVRDFLPVDEAADLMSKIAEIKTFNGIINCCSGKPISVRKFVEMRLRDKGIVMTLNAGKYPYLKYEPFEFWGDRSKLDSLLHTFN